MLNITGFLVHFSHIKDGQIPYPCTVLAFDPSRSCITFCKHCIFCFTPRLTAEQLFILEIKNGKHYKEETSKGMVSSAREYMEFGGRLRFGQKSSGGARLRCDAMNLHLFFLTLTVTQINPMTYGQGQGYRF